MGPTKLCCHMDSEHRHELKSNDLVETITGFKDWWAKHGLHASIIVVVVAGGVIFWRVTSTNKVARQENDRTAVAGQTTPYGFMQVAGEVESSGLRDYALIRAGDLWLEQAAMTPAQTEAGESDTQQTPEEMLQAAKSAYQQVIAKTQSAPHRFSAMLGLAAVAEGEQDWDQAANIYDDVIRQAGQKYNAHRDEAQLRKGMLKSLKIPLVFAADPPVAETGPVDESVPLDTTGQVDTP